MRIIAGKFKNRQLSVPKGVEMRPTASRLRETLFNILQGSIEGARFVDICAGSGAIGFEALSRGAATVTFLEKDPKAAAAIKKNIELLDVGKEAFVLVGDATKILSRLNSTYDLIFADPPYNQGLSLEILELVDKHHLLAEGGQLMIEEAAKIDLPERSGALQLINERKTGAGRLWLYGNS
jgi:16S rRNA (guanine966-N2)-methyltransferase